MPKGKARSSGNVYAKHPISYAVNTRTLRRYKKKSHPKLTKERLLNYRLSIADAISTYIGEVNSDGYKTETEIRNELSRFISSIQNLLKAINGRNYKEIYDWKIRVSQQLSGLSLPSRKRLYFLFVEPLPDSLHLKRSINDLDPAIGLDNQCMSLFEIIINSYPKNMDYLGSSVPNLSSPPLNRLVRSLAPIWTDTTGKSVRRAGQNYEFAEWVISLLRVENTPAPTEVMIEKVCKGQTLKE